MAINKEILRKNLQKIYDRKLFAKDILSQVFNSNFTLFAYPNEISDLVNNSEKKVIEKVFIYGRIALDDNTEINCYEVLLQPNVRIEYNKVAIQHFIRKLLNAGEASLINFISPTNQKLWRLTLVAKDSVVKESSIEEKTTNPHRYTYLLGPSEGCTTPAERLELLSTKAKLSFNDIIDAFSVEKLSKAFFDEYKMHYQFFVDELIDANYFKSVFNKNEKDLRDFVKKLLGRIVFLYFVQKKGWLGASNTNYKDGTQDFIFKLFIDSGGDETFYSKWLCRLFFDTLNNQRENDDFKMPNRSIVKVPFLNGGLFEKEDVDKSLITFDPTFFHNPDNSDDPSERGFLDFLNSYNFTVHEDRPDDKVVAVDPEMLSHIFENLLEDNKDKGAFYTPKEIVHDMSQQSLIQYLLTHLSKEYKVYNKIGKDEFELFGDETNQGQLNLLEVRGEKGLTIDDIRKIVIDKDISELDDNQLRKIDKLLDNLKACDPAIGSGAFPMGLLQEIFAIKELIAYQLNLDWNPSSVKENIIQNSIYGVDIEKGAVDIARLRFWLSLIVDQEKPKPLPNLDFKIVIGDSLVNRMEIDKTVEIFDIDWNIKTYSTESVMKYQLKIKDLLLKIGEYQKQFFNPLNLNKKALAIEIRNAKLELLINAIKQKKEEFINKSNEYVDDFFEETKKAKEDTSRIKNQIYQYDKVISKLNYLLTHPQKSFNLFSWELNFPEVLNRSFTKGVVGFDIIIANPPYIKEYTNRNAFEGFRKSPYYQGKMDIWYGFACRMLDLLKPNGIECFIAQNNWITSAGASILRNKVVSETEIKVFTDFGNYKVFETAGIQTMIYILQKSTPKSSYKIKYSILINDKISKKELVKFLDFDKKDNNSEKYLFNFSANEIKSKPFTFNNNQATIVLDKIKLKGQVYLTEEEVANGIHPHYDFISKKIANKSKGKFKNGEGIFGLSNRELQSLNLSKEEKKLVKPYYTSEELGRYYADKKNKYWLIYTGSEFKNPKAMKSFPNLKRHLDKFRNVITSDNKPYGLHRAREERFFKGESIVALRKCSDKPSFTYTDFNCYVSATFYVIKTDRFNMKFLTALLNSKLIAYWLRNKGKMQGNNYQIDKEPLMAIPLVEPTNKISNRIEKIVDKILLQKSQDKDTSNLEEQIDIIIYKLYDLTYADIRVIDNTIEDKISKKDYEKFEIE